MESKCEEIKERVKVFMSELSLNETLEKVIEFRHWMH
jgi:amidohydrolase